MKKGVLVDNAADEKQVQSAKRKERFLRKDELDDVRHILSDIKGRRFLWKYLRKCGVYKTSFTGNSDTFYNEGMRNIGLMILADIQESDAEAYLKMLKENKEMKIAVGKMSARVVGMYLAKNHPERIEAATKVAQSMITSW